MSRIVVVSNPLPPSSFFDASYVKRPTDPNASMPPMMITRESSLGSTEVTLPGGDRVLYHLFTAPYNSRDCYYFIRDEIVNGFGAMGGFPTTRLGIQKLADLGVYCEDWSVAVKNREDERFLQAIVKAFRNLLTVEEVHAL